MDKILLIFVLAAVFSFAHVGEAATSCYHCVYTTGGGILNDARCVDPFDRSSGVTNVTTCENGCVKTSLLIDGVSETWARDCNTLSSSECVNTCRSQAGTTACVHCCTGDFCNGVGAIYSVSLLATMCGSFLAVFVSHFW
ncbi:uncharacterized protein LOC115927097 [Strongylocentrotus purpuratus]|uniref:Uncharacterized protein n=1 Tax=Strongylocentrotus purpuratus TaxID=7668 RepID=A0A7M7PFF6_STRPU|nr:uncharacterized protein LOC115927097 [Strongylocentrotus purpuratus]